MILKPVKNSEYLLCEFAFYSFKKQTNITNFIFILLIFNTLYLSQKSFMAIKQIIRISVIDIPELNRHNTLSLGFMKNLFLLSLLLSLIIG
jgi:hypothetical protein